MVSEWKDWRTLYRAGAPPAQWAQVREELRAWLAEQYCRIDAGEKANP